MQVKQPPPARARELLDRAKRAVEIAIEKDEQAALASLGIPPEKKRKLK